jgi:cobalt-zinc-cadmium efflux system membrane fusion protein
VARIIPPLMGQVQDLRLKVGDSVRKGDTLFSIYSREAATALSEHMDSHKDLDLAEKTFAMTQDLYEHQASSRIALDQARNDLDKAKLRVNRTEESLRVLGIANDSASSTIAKIPVRSPLNGTVIERKVTEGQFVQPDVNPLLTIASLDDVWVLGDVFERDLHLIRIGQRASVVTDAYPDEMFNASVSWISDVVDDTTRTVKVRFLVANAGRRLKPEMFASANIFLQESQKGLTVPAEAVLSEGGHNYVYVCVGEGSFVRRPVEVTQDDGTKSRVINGLKTGDKVVVKGAILINSEREKKET